MKDNGIIFVVGIKIDDLDKLVPQAGGIWFGNKDLISKDYMNNIEVNVYSDFYHRHDDCRFAGVQWNTGVLDNFSIIGNYIVYVSKDKGKAINKISMFYLANKVSRKSILKGAYI